MQDSATLINFHDAFLPSFVFGNAASGPSSFSSFSSSKAPGEMVKVRTVWQVCPGASECHDMPVP